MASNLFIERVAIVLGKSVAEDMQERAKQMRREPRIHDLHYVLHSRDRYDADSAEEFYTQRFPEVQINEEDIVFI
jgi:hypothetical protein